MEGSAAGLQDAIVCRVRVLVCHVRVLVRVQEEGAQVVPKNSVRLLHKVRKTMGKELTLSDEYVYR